MIACSCFLFKTGIAMFVMLMFFSSPLSKFKIRPDFEMWEQLLFIELYYGRNKLIFHELRCSETEVNIESSQGI